MQSHTPGTYSARVAVLRVARRTPAARLSHMEIGALNVLAFVHFVPETLAATIRCGEWHNDWHNYPLRLRSELPRRQRRAAEIQTAHATKPARWLLFRSIFKTQYVAFGACTVLEYSQVNNMIYRYAFTVQIHLGNTNTGE